MNILTRCGDNDIADEKTTKIDIQFSSAIQWMNSVFGLVYRVRFLSPDHLPVAFNAFIVARHQCISFSQFNMLMNSNDNNAFFVF